MVFWKGLKVFIKGALMGAVNVVPVSSGTLSLVLGVYERFINSIRSLNHKNFKYLFRGEFKEFNRKTDFIFFCVIMTGMLVGMVLTSIFLKTALESYAVYTWSFFIGLILASAITVINKIEKFSLKNIIILLIGFAISFVMSLYVNPVENNHFYYVFLCGVLGCSGMVVPGISGSHLLLLMGNYKLIVLTGIPYLSKMSTFMSGMKILTPFLLGGLVSIVGLSHLLSWLMRRFRNETLSALSGFMIGSLPIVYPWKILPDLEAGVVSRIAFYFPGFTWELAIAVLMAALGAGGVLLIEWLAKKDN